MRKKNHYLEAFGDGKEWPLPVVQVSEALNPFAADGVLMYVALGYHLPYDTMKFLAVLGLLQDAKENGKLKKVHTLVEATSGATGVVLAQLAPSVPFNIHHVVLVMKGDVPLGKKYPPQLAGAVIRHPDPNDRKEKNLSTIALARKLGKRPGWLNLDQYANPANAKLYREWAGPKIVDAVGEVNVFVGPTGTGGTNIGLSPAFRAHNPSVTIVGAMCAAAEEIGGVSVPVEVPGVRDMEGMKEIRLPWRDALDEIVFVKQRVSYLSALWFQWLMGLTPGASGGLDYAGTLLFLKRRKDAGTLDELRGKDRSIRVVTLFHDNARPYVVDRFTAFLPEDMQRPSTAPKPWDLLW